MSGTPRTFRGDLLIDGYNLLHAAGFARATYGPGEFDRMRQRLIKLLAGQLSSRERQRTTVVFDATGKSLGPTPPTHVHGICVMFADGDGDADLVIERLIRQNSAPRRLHVVSSDHRLQRAARRRRSKYYDSEVFLARIAQRPTPQERAQHSEPAEKQHGITTPGEVDAWANVFGEINLMDSKTNQASSPAASNVDQRHSPPETKACGPGADTTAPTSARHNDVRFWEERIAELWQQTDRDRPST